MTAATVVCQVFKNGSPTDNLILEIQTDAAGAPSGTVVATASVPQAPISGTGIGSTVMFPITAALSPSTTYWLVWSRSGGRDLTNHTAIVKDASAPASYADGICKTRNTGGVWGAAQTYDLPFAVSSGAAGTIDGGTFTMAAADNWGVIGLALKPAAPAGPVTHTRSAALALTGLIATIGRELLARTAVLNATGAVASSAIFWRRSNGRSPPQPPARSRRPVSGSRRRSHAPPRSRRQARSPPPGSRLSPPRPRSPPPGSIATVGRETLARPAALAASGTVTGQRRQAPGPQPQRCPRRQRDDRERRPRAAGPAGRGRRSRYGHRERRRLHRLRPFRRRQRDRPDRDRRAGTTLPLRSPRGDRLDRGGGTRNRWPARWSCSAAGAVASTGVGFTIVSRSAALTAAATASASGTIVVGADEFERAASLAATGSVTAVGRETISRSATVTATGLIASAGRELLPRLVRVDAAGSSPPPARDDCSGRRPSAQPVRSGSVRRSRASPNAAPPSPPPGRSARAGSPSSRPPPSFSATGSIATVGREQLARSGSPGRHGGDRQRPSSHPRSPLGTRRHRDDRLREPARHHRQTRHHRHRARHRRLPTPGRPRGSRQRGRRAPLRLRSGCCSAPARSRRPPPSTSSPVAPAPAPSSSSVRSPPSPPRSPGRPGRSPARPAATSTGTAAAASSSAGEGEIATGTHRQARKDRRLSNGRSRHLRRVPPTAPLRQHPLDGSTDRGIGSGGGHLYAARGGRAHPPDADPALPVARNFTTELGTALDYWYRIVFADATGDTCVPTTPVQNVAGGTVPTVSPVRRDRRAGAGAAAQGRRRRPDAGDATRDRGGVSAEIDSYLAPDAPYFPPYPALVVQVCLERAVEHWKQEQSPFGLIAMGGESPPAFASRNSWRRHAQTLLPLKASWGVG